MNDAVERLWNDAMTAACLFAVMPHELMGIRVRAGAGPARQQWLEGLLARLRTDVPVQRIHPQIGDDALLGGLDLAATLARGSTAYCHGALSKADGGVMILAMAERASPALAGRLAAALDAAEMTIERDGMTATVSTKFGLIALDEGEADEAPPQALLERCSFQVDLNTVAMRDLRPCSFSIADIDAARKRAPQVRISDELIAALARTALELGILPLRSSLLACAVARASAALFGRMEVEEADAALAARLVLAPRAQRLPAEPPQAVAEQTESANPSPPVDNHDSSGADRAAQEDEAHESAASAPPADTGQDHPSGQHEPVPEDALLAATVASIPEDLLNQLINNDQGGRSAHSGRSGAVSTGANHGRAAGPIAQQAAGKGRLDLISTLRAAAPWQKLRRNNSAHSSAPHAGPLVRVQRQDFRSRNYIRRTRTTTVFAVDASGSAALHRLAETKGAIELMLAQCYVRRDQVAVISFRDQGATLALPPTRSLVRAKRSLAGLAGGGGTPLASALNALVALADTIRRRGETPVLVVLSDGRANIAADQSRNRDLAHQDAMRAALNLRRMELTALFVDTSMRPSDRAAALAHQMGARYMTLPFVNAQSLSKAVMDAST